MRRCSAAAVSAAMALVATLAITPRGACAQEERPRRGPSVWAVVVSVEDYRDPALGDSPGAGRDAEAIAGWLVETAGWGSSHVLRMSDDGDARHGRPQDRVDDLRPTRENLRWATTAWLEYRARPGDVVVLSFSGRAVATSEGQHLLPIDAVARDLDGTGWSPEAAIDDLALRSRCSVVCWLDTSLQGRGEPATTVVEAASGTLLLNRLARWPGVTAWLAADGHPAAVERSGSVFAAALVEALGTRPDTLIAALGRLNASAKLRAQGFRTRGGIPPALNLWPPGLVPADRLADEPRLLLQQGHADRITAVALAADESRMITASLDSTVRIWRRTERDATLLRVLPYHRIGVRAMAFAPDGRLMASGDGAGQVQVWDLAADAQRPRAGGPSPHSAGLAELAFLPNGGHLLSLDLDGLCVLWEPAGRFLRPRVLRPEGVRHIAAASRAAGAAAALATADGTVQLLDPEGQPAGSIDGPGGPITVLLLSNDGRTLALGDRDGHVHVHDLSDSGRPVYEQTYDGPIEALALGAGSLLAIGAGDAAFLADTTADGPGLRLPGIDGEVTALGFTADAGWLLAATKPGDAVVWDLSDREQPAPHALVGEDDAGASCLAFLPGGRGIVAGERDGGVRSWSLPELGEQPRLAPHRGQVAALAVSPDGRRLLQITRDGAASVWDLLDGRGPRRLDGYWSSGVFLPDGDRLAMTHDANDGGSVALLDLATGRALEIAFDRPKEEGDEEPVDVEFVRVTASPDGRRLAAASAPGREEIVCLWSVDGGAPTVIRPHEGTITALAFSTDGRRLLTAGEDGRARIWDLDDGTPRPVASLEASAGEVVTAAALGPGEATRVVAASQPVSGPSRVVLWQAAKGADASKARPILLGEMSGRVHAVAFMPDGRWVAAAGEDHQLRLWRLDPSGRAVDVPVEPQHVERVDPERLKVYHHTEQIHALATWPDRPALVSGGDDATLRLWRLDAEAGRGTLLGTFCDAPGNLGAAGPAEGSWVVYTPAGVYDGSRDGDRMVTFVDGGEIRPLDQYAERFHHFGLADALRRGESPTPPAPEPPPFLVIDPPAAADPDDRDVTLRVAPSDSRLPLDDLRLYQNGVPVLLGPGDYRPAPDGRGLLVDVSLRHGENRIYALAGRPEGVDARSADVVLRFDGFEEPGRVHIVAIGVSEYVRNALEYADDDALQIARHLGRNTIGPADEPGEVVVLTDREVTERAVDDAFGRIRHRAEGRPQDTVVVFLAGHADVLKDRRGRERFSLLLSEFPFPAAAPRVALNRGPGGGVANAPSSSYLTYSSIYLNLLHVDALQRLVIVDACQAAAIESDQGVRSVQRLMEEDSRRLRTSYLLAARRGEPAGEAPALEHGLLTYVLLRGMRAEGLRPVPIEVADLRDDAGADLDGDRIITTRELRHYTDRMLPLLAERFPLLVQRAGGKIPPPPQDLHLQGDEVSFPIAVVPAGRPPAD